ncbi:MAG: 30S ribosomal protein S6 [Holosporales bacterium]|jgi:small subunit ribosomal protein S6|nr:30S ribosomal protein S6 [Holosporales bacterium]
MSFYEVVFIVKQDASAGRVEQVTNEYIALIKEHGGEVTKTEFCGLRYLAYPIKKNRRGHYVLLNVVLEQDHVRELERKLSLNEDILRSLIVKVEILDNNPSALMRRSYKDNVPVQQQAQQNEE